jgi:hypothetical protein
MDAARTPGYDRSASRRARRRGDAFRRGTADASRPRAMPNAFPFSFRYEGAPYTSATALNAFALRAASASFAAGASTRLRARDREMTTSGRTSAMIPRSATASKTSTTTGSTRIARRRGAFRRIA